ncbi:iron-sulfur cluster assembly protein [Scopulibacillus daqui]|uniref:Iron-sulfur cluster assembly protein n=1 Tax=Scopulibacillus daqui TaxID=1469162 RepID=A0ABS2Q1A8_9BACL|nr:iron-sulfur cluster insertion protein ErpA [Scopulibacillus daqui]MBM7646077.1 iron-sulfur cluster assembly protein [Scopulibacillus daqui]
MDLNITVTDAAMHRIKEMRKEEGNESLFLRLGVKGGGCTGLTYGMGFDNELKDDDQSFENKGLKIVIDSESAPLLRDVTIDYKQNMMGGGFIINNPNAIATCGCGQSFKTAANAGTPAKDC